MLHGDHKCSHGVVKQQIPPEDFNQAAQLATNAEWLKRIISDTKDSEDDLLQLTTYEPAVTAIVELGLFESLVDTIDVTLAIPKVLLSLLTSSNAHSCIPQSQVDRVLLHLVYNKHWEALATFAEDLPSTWNLNKLKTLLGFKLGEAGNTFPIAVVPASPLIAILESKRLLALLLENGAIDTLFNLIQSHSHDNYYLEFVKVFASHSASHSFFSPNNIDILLEEIFVRGRLSREAIEVLKCLPSPTFEPQLTAKLSAHFTAPVLTDAHFQLLKRVLKFNKAAEILVQFGFVSTLINLLCSSNTASAEPILQALHQIASFTYPPLLTQQHITSKDCAALVKAQVPTEKLPSVINDSVLAYLRLPPISRDELAPWYIDPTMLHAPIEQKYATLPAPPRDCDLVAQFYQRCPVQGYDVKSVTIVYNEKLFISFAARADALQERKGKTVFEPHWRTDNRISHNERTQRQKIMDQFYSIASHKSNITPDVHFVLGWHGTSNAALVSLLTAGFANLASTDAGFFGKGLYTTPDAEYAFRVYNSGVLLLNWVATFSPFPVTALDEPELAEKGNFRNYDSHFVPVYSPSHPHGVSYHACEHEQVAQYSELVVFEAAQMLAHYIVVLQPTMPHEIVTIQNKFVGKKPITSPGNKTDMESWAVDDVCSWVATLRLSQDYSSLLRNNSINGEVLQSMSQQDWKDVGMNNFGDSRLLALKVSRYENYTNK